MDGLVLIQLCSWEDEEAGPPAFRDKGAESASSSDEEEGSAPRPSGIATPNDPFTPAVVAVLSEAYIEHGLDVLLRPNKTTKPTPQRVALVQRLQGAGWDGGEDLIQSWGRMLDRDVGSTLNVACIRPVTNHRSSQPKKQRRLEPYQFSGNRPDSTTVPPQASGSGSGRRGGGGGGGGNRGSGRGRGGRGMNRGKAARARGHDRKFRGAFGT